MSLSVSDFPYEVPELHCHVRSDKDAFIFADKLADRLKELGMPGIAITDHGVVTSIEDYRHVLQAAGLKVIPGCELYIDGGRILGRQHGIVLAVDDEGWHGIGKIVTRANETRQGGYPVISSSELKEFGRKYQGHIIFMTACMQGVISTIFLSNDKIEKLVTKVKKKQAKYISPDSAKYKSAERNLAEIDERIEALKLQRDEAKRLAEMKFASREKKAEKLRGDEKEAALSEIFKDKAASEKAKQELVKLKEELKTSQRQRTAINKTFREVRASADKYLEYSAEIVEYRSSVLTKKQMNERAEEELKSYVNAFGEGNVYAELQYHGIPEEQECFIEVACTARRLNVPLVATNDVHMLTNSEDDILRRCLLRSLRYGEKFEEPSESDRELYLKTTDERIEWLSKILPDKMIKEAFDNAIEIFERCNVEFKTGKHYPIASTDPKKDIEKLVSDGIRRRFPDGFPDKEVYEKRIKYELGIIEGMGYDNYHLVVREFLTYGSLLGKVPKEHISEAPLDTEELEKYIKDNGWEEYAGYRIGTGRGSDGGSLVCYLLGITNLDPIKHGLIFERFLNPERVSMPDIDSDISANTRQKVIDHCKYVYGRDSVCGIMSTNAQGPKGALGIASKFYGLRKNGESLRRIGDRISSDIPSAPGTSFATQVDRTTGRIDEYSEDTVPVMEYLTDKWIDKNPDKELADDCKTILHWAEVMEGVFTSYGLHAAGVVIVQKGTDVSDVLPLMWSDKLDMMVTQCSKDDVEANGLLKFDFLGLQTLDIITEALQMIQQNTGRKIDVLKLDTADKRVYEDIFQTGRTKAVFQFESDGMRNMLKKFHPTEFSDLVLLNAAYRPGPMQYLDNIIEVKNGRAKVGYLTPELEPILKNTYGAMIYQEQVMQVCQSLAGYTFGGADLVRRAMSKKKKEKLEHERKAFIYGDPGRDIKGCVNNGISESIANEIFDQMMHFASYAFNKSHAAAYAYNAYITAWLKEYYPAEFIAAALNWAKDQDEIYELVTEAKNIGVEVLPPDINLSREDFTAYDGKILFSLSAVKGVNTYAKQVVTERDNGLYTSLADFALRCGGNRKAAENLISAGAFDAFGDNRAEMTEDIPKFLACNKKYKEKESFIKSAEAVLEKINSLHTDEDFIKAQTDKGLIAEITERTDRDALEKRRDSAIKTIRDIKASVESEKSHVKEGPEKRLADEKAVLGAYISASPLDGRPEAKDLHVTDIADAMNGTSALYGVISDVKTAKRKKDGKPMAFFTLSDRTGHCRCACFADKYAEIGSAVEDGAVIVAKGNFLPDSFGNNERQFSVSDIDDVEVKQFPVCIKVHDFALFHIGEEKDFRNMYESVSGHPLFIWDEMADKFREMRYKVNDDIMARDDVIRL